MTVWTGSKNSQRTKFDGIKLSKVKKMKGSELMKLKCSFCEVGHWSWENTRFSHARIHVAQMDHNILLGTMIRNTAKWMTEMSDWVALRCYLDYNIWSMESSPRANDDVHIRNIGIFGKLRELAGDEDRMKYIAKCQEYEEELYNHHLAELKMMV